MIAPVGAFAAAAYSQLGVMRFAYKDRRHRPRGARARISELGLWMHRVGSDSSRLVSFTNEKGTEHTMHGHWTWEASPPQLIISFHCLGGIMRPNTRWNPAADWGFAGFRAVDFPARMWLTSIEMLAIPVPSQRYVANSARPGREQR